MGDEALDAIFSDEPIEAMPEVVVENVVQEPVAEPEPVIEAPVIEAPVQEEKSVPLATFLDMRDKQKESDRRALELERQIAEMRSTQQQKQGAPDPFDDPAGYAAYNEQNLANALYEQKLQFSYGMAAEKHGQDVTEAARIWAIEKAQADPAFDAMLTTELKRQMNPVDWIVRQHKRDSLMQQVGEDPDEFVRRRAVELGLTATAPVAPVVTATQQPASTPKAPPKSLVNAPAHGGVSEVATGKLAGLDAVFPG